MPKDGNILLVEDDDDDRLLFETITNELGLENKILCFSNTGDAFNFLCSPHEPLFLIFCDINLPGKNGLEFKKRIDENPFLRKKSIPFIFYSTNASQEDVNSAYTQLNVQGFFLKGYNYGHMKDLLRTIFDYWISCQHPNMQ